jgi:hypothetical protein
VARAVETDGEARVGGESHPAVGGTAGRAGGGSPARETLAREGVYLREQRRGWAIGMPNGGGNRRAAKRRKRPARSIPRKSRR